MARRAADPVGSGFADFERGFARWWAEKGTGFRVVLASDGSEVVGMGFLGLVNRVPGPDDDWMPVSAALLT